MPPQQWYRAYGLSLLSDRTLPGLVALNSAPREPQDILIEFDPREGAGCLEHLPNREREELWYTTDITDAQGNPALKIWKRKDTGDFLIRYTNGLTFQVNRAVSSISVQGLEAMVEGQAAPYLLGPVLGIVLRLRGVTCLHASAVDIDGKAVAFVGAMGAGKSTTAAIFAQNGHSVLTDDIVALKKCGGCFTVDSGYPFLNLLPDAVTLLCGSPEAVPFLDPAFEKRQLILDGDKLRFQKEALPLGAVYLLAGRAEELSAAAVRPMTAQEALIELTSNTYANKMLDTEMRAREFRLLGELVGSVPVRRLAAPARSPNPANFYRVIREDAGAAIDGAQAGSRSG